MPVKKITTEQFLKLAATVVTLDVRSPGEYAHAHIPGAHTFPLFSDEERKIVGTLYKQESREKAVKRGLEYFGPKMVRMIEEAVTLTNTSKQILLYCWRGGMRSAGVAWLLDIYGFDVYTLAGGYKTYRRWALEQFDKDYPFKIIAGNTGSGKTGILGEMKKKGLKVIDLEDLASHKGSAFGAIDMPPQPSQEMFENRLALNLYKNHFLHADDTAIDDSIYIEDESQRIGRVNIPVKLWKQIRAKPLIFIELPFGERLKYIIKDYGKGDKEQLIDAIIRIKQRLGGLETKMAINYLLEDNIPEAFSILLTYYDKHYKKALHSRENWQSLYTSLAFEEIDIQTITQRIVAIETRHT